MHTHSYTQLTATLGEHRIRELNDEINKLMKQKYYQERRIVELGGIDYRNAPKQYYDIEGKELPGMRGYKYYGVSRDLPGIRELFQAEKDASIGSGKKIRKSSMTTSELYKVITSDYYGYRDDDDGVLAKKEGAKELSLIKRSIKEYHNKISSGNSCSIASASVNGDDEYKIMSNILNTLSTITSSGSSSSSNSNDTTNSNSNDTTNSIGNVNSGNNDNSNNNDELADIIMNQKKRSLLEQYL